MTEVQRRIGLMGGTFDPIHYGHLVTAEAARYKYLLDEVIFVPSGNPPHKKERRISSADDRLMMSTLATVTNSFFSVSDLEIIRGGYSYTYDTVREFKQLYPHSEIYFITGADAISEIITWKKVELLFDQCYFIAATRPGFDFDELLSLPDKFRDKISFMEIPALSISSTDIRRRVYHGRPIKYLLPEAVENYIQKEGLYLPDEKEKVGLEDNF